MSTFDRENTATSDVREDLNRMPDRNRVFSPALPLISLTHGGGLKRLSATVGLATALFASAALVTAGLATARPIAPNPVGCPPGQIIVWNLAPPGLDLQQVQQGITDDPWCGSPAQMSPAQGPSPGTPPGGNGASAGTHRRQRRLCGHPDRRQRRLCGHPDRRQRRLCGHPARRQRRICGHPARRQRRLCGHPARRQRRLSRPEPAPAHWQTMFEV